MQIPAVPFLRGCYFHWSPRAPMGRAWHREALHRPTMHGCTSPGGQFWGGMKEGGGLLKTRGNCVGPDFQKRMPKAIWGFDSYVAEWDLELAVSRNCLSLNCSSHYEKIPQKSPTNQAEPEELSWGRHFLVTVAQFSWTTVFSYQMINHVAWHIRLTLGEPFDSRCSNKNILAKTEDNRVLMINRHLASARDWYGSRTEVCLGLQRNRVKESRSQSIPSTDW